MNDDELGRRLARRLDAGLEEIPAAVLQKLAGARQAALAGARRTQAVGGVDLATAGGGYGHTAPRLPLHARHLVPLLALLAGLAVIYFWQAGAPREEPDEVELLAGELPPNAYLDEGFDRWLAHNAQR
jgi:hypothetical protein